MTRERRELSETQVIALPATDDARATLIWLHGAGLASKARAMYDDDTARGARPAPPRRAIGACARARAAGARRPADTAAAQACV
jgi:hypothetical protein